MKKFLGTFMTILLLFPLTSCTNPEKETKKEKIVVDDEYQSVCVSGVMPVPTTSGQNILPYGYWGNYPDSGVIEIGGRAGDEHGKRLSPIDFKLENRVGFTLAISFDSDPMYFPTNHFTKQVGYEFSYVDVDLQEKTKVVTYDAEKFGSIFQDNEPNYAQGPEDNELLRTTFYIYHPQNAVGINFYLTKGQKLNYVKIIYGDQPQNIVNVALFKQYWNMDQAISNIYGGVDCSKKDYVKNIGQFPVYHLYSNYGTIYSKNFLLSSFVAKDDDDDFVHVREIEDKDGYFTKGATAPLGSKFTVKILASDDNGNTSFITFIFTVKDFYGPIITNKEQGDITCSYRMSTNDILKEYFVISDNLDTELNTKLRLKNGSLIPSNQIGDFECILTSEDSSKNLTEYEFTLHYIDDIPPVIDNEFDELNLSVSNAYTTQQLKDLFTAVDEIDGPCEVQIVENTYSAHAREIGSYMLSIESSDKSGNKATKTIQIHVSDEDGPVFFAKESFISFAQGRAPTQEELISSLIRQEVLPDKRYQKMSVVSGTAISNDLAEGVYEATYLFEAYDNSQEMVDISFEVLPKDSFQTTVEEEKTFWEMIADFFISIWEAIVSFFTGK